MLSHALIAGLSGYIVLIVSGLYYGQAFSAPDKSNENEYILLLYRVSSYIGTIIGAAVSAILLTIYGNRVPMGLSALLLIIAGSIHITLDTLSMLIMGRILVGCAGGMALVTQIIYLGEISPSARRGKYIVYISSAIYFGILVQFICREFLAFHKLNIATGAITVTLGIMAVISLRSLKESPYYLIYKENDKQATRNLTILTGFERNSREVRKEYDEIKKSIMEECQWELPVHKDLLNNNKTAFGISLIFQIVYSSSFHIFLMDYHMSYFIVLLFASNEYNKLILAFLITSTARLFGTLLSALFVDQFGRRILLIISGLSGALSLLVITGIFYGDEQFQPDFRSINQSNNFYIAAAFVVVYDIGTALGFACIPNVILGESFTEPSKVFGVSVSIIIQAFTGFLFDVINENNFKKITMELNLARYIVVALFLLIGAFISFKVLPETKQKTHKEVIDMYKIKKRK